MKAFPHQTILKMIAAVVGIAAITFAQAPQRPAEKIIFSPNDTQRCLKCHGMANFAFRDSLTVAVHHYSVAADSFKVSVHGKLNCQQCHTDILQYPHTFATARKKVSCGDDCHAPDANGNPFTHQAVIKDFQRSAHRKGLTDPTSDSPTCTTCHGNLNPHYVAKAQKALTPKEKMALCTTCHENNETMAKHNVNPEAVASYKRSFHYKAILFGVTTTAVCQDCHTAHHILPKDSANSSIAVGNIAGTCGKEQCHPGAKMNFAMSGANHLDLRVEREPILKFEEQFFILLTLGSMAMLAVGIVLDIQKKFGWLELLMRFLHWAGRVIADVFYSRRKVYTFLKKILID